MIQITKIFRFEMAHAIYGYPGKCGEIHGHSYELHVTISSDTRNGYLPATGFIIDFKWLKQVINEWIIRHLDHKLVISKTYLEEKLSFLAENLVIWEAEPSAENILIYIQAILAKKLPEPLKLVRLKLFETSDSYAEWVEC